MQCTFNALKSQLLWGRNGVKGSDCERKKGYLSKLQKMSKVVGRKKKNDEQKRRRKKKMMNYKIRIKEMIDKPPPNKLFERLEGFTFH